MSERLGQGATPIFDEDGDQGLIGWRDSRGRNWMIPRWSTDAAGNVGLVAPGSEFPVSIKGAPPPRQASLGVPLWDFSTLAGYSVNNSGSMALVSAPEVSAQLGKTSTNAIQFTIPAGTNSELSFPTLGAAPQIPNRSAAIVLEMIGGDTGSQATFNFFLGVTAAYTNMYLASNQLNQHGVTAFTPIEGTTLSQWTPTGSPTWDTLTAGKIRINAGTATVTVIVHGVFVAQSAPPTVSLIHDDGSISGFTELMPRLNRYGFKAGFSIAGALIGSTASFMNASQLDRLYADGHDMIPHGASALNTFGTAAAAFADIDQNRRYLLDRGYVRGRSLYVYPNGVVEFSNADRLSVRQYLASVGVRAGWIASGTAFHTMKSGHAYLLPRFPVNSTVNTTTLFNTLDSAIESGRGMTLMLHQIVAAGATGPDATRANVDTILAGLATRQASGALRVVSPTEQMVEMGVIPAYEA